MTDQTRDFDAGEDVYARLKALGDHNSIKDLNQMRLIYRRQAQDHEGAAKLYRELVEQYEVYREDLVRSESMASDLKKMYKAIEKLIAERKAEQPEQSVSEPLEDQNLDN